MRNGLPKLIRGFVVFGGIVLFFLGFKAYFTFIYVNENTFTDGFGRLLTKTPLIARMIFGEERMWVGWKWFFIDMLIFWASIFVGGKLLGLADDIEKNNDNCLCNSKSYTAKKLSETLNVSVAEVLKVLFSFGVVVQIDEEINRDVAIKVIEDFKKTECK